MKIMVKCPQCGALHEWMPGYWSSTYGTVTGGLVGGKCSCGWRGDAPPGYHQVSGDLGKSIRIEYQPDLPVSRGADCQTILDEIYKTLDVGSWATTYGPDDSTDTLYHIKGYRDGAFYSVIIIMEGAEVTVSYGCPDGFLYQHPTWKEIRGA